MVSNRIVLILFLLFSALASSAQYTSDTKDEQIARRKMRVGMDTSKYWTSQVTVIDSNATHRQAITAKSVWDLFGTFSSSITTDSTLAGAGTVGSPLKIAQQSASNGQVLKWDNTAGRWKPGADLGTTYTGGTGINVTGTVISNTGDLSATNELNTTFDVSGGNLRMIDAGGTLTVPVTTIAPVQAVTGGTGISVTGTTTRTVTNTAPDLTVGLTGAGITAITGTYPNFTITSTEVDGSTINEIELPSQTGNTGKVLSTNGTSPLWITPNAGTIMGSISSGQVAYGSGTNTIAGTSSFLWDNTNKSLMVGDGTKGKISISQGSTWSQAISAGSFEIGSFSTNNCWFADNIYYDSGWKYRNNGSATLAYFQNGNFEVSTAPSGSAGATAAYTKRLVVKPDATVNVPLYGKLVIEQSTDYSQAISAGALEFGSYNTNNCWFGNNLYFDGGWKYRNPGYGNLFYFYNGGYEVRTAPSGSSGSSATLSTRLWLTNTGSLGIGISPASDRRFVATGLGLTSSTYSARFANSYEQYGLSVRDDRAVVFDNLTGTGNRLMQLDLNGVAARSSLDPATLVTGNIYTINGTLPENRTVTAGNYNLKIDASTTTNSISTPFTIKGKADGTNEMQAITMQNAAGNPLSYWYVTNTYSLLAATAGSSMKIGAGSNFWDYIETGYTKSPLLGVDPTVTDVHSALWFNSTSSRFKYNKTNTGTTPRQIANVEDDVVGTSIVSTSSAYTLTGTVFRVQADANTNAITITVDGTMQEGYTYLVRCRRNGTNAITISAGAGYVLAVDGDSALTPSTYTCTAYEVIKITRYDTVVFVDK